MSDEKSNVSDKASEIAKNIWLAGLGAYGKAFDEAQDRLDKAAKEPPRLFKDLVKKGARLEDEVRDSLSSMRKTSTSSVEERINKVRESFNFNLHSRGQELEAINAKLDALTAKVDALARAMDSGARTKAKAKAKAKTKTKAKAKARAKPASRR
ncbi:MAG: phasin family protein [Halieaceae bacterium]